MFYSLVALQVTLNAYSDRLATPYQLSSVVQSGRRQESLSSMLKGNSMSTLPNQREERNRSGLSRGGRDSWPSPTRRFPT